MRNLLGVTTGIFLLATPCLADKYYGELVNAASGASLPAAFEVLDDTRLSYCFNDTENNCFELSYVRLQGEVIRASFSKDNTGADGTVTTQTNLWTWTPTETGYDGTFAIQYDDSPPQMQTEGKFSLRE